MHIQKIGADINNIQLEWGTYYIIELEDYILHPFDNFTLSSNWNKGVIPVSKYLMVTPIKIVGKMVQMDACGYSLENNATLNDSYSGLWLPRKSFKIIEKCK